jgi:hypothetical protein
LLKIPVAKSRYVGAAIDDRPEQLQVGSGKKVEAAKATVFFCAPEATVCPGRAWRWSDRRRPL